MFLVTGCGRSGTMWAARLFTAVGRPCVHEQQFTPDRHGPIVRAESSWLAVPYLSDLPGGVRVVRMIRDPYQVVRSVMWMQFLTHKDRTPFERFVTAHRPWITEPDDKLGRAIRWATTWDSPLDDHSHTVLSTDMEAHQIAEVVATATGRGLAVGHVRRALTRLGKVNARARRAEPSDADIDAHPEGWRVRERAEQWGYR